MVRSVQSGGLVRSGCKKKGGKRGRIPIRWPRSEKDDRTEHKER